jgi:hypothetical protein
VSAAIDEASPKGIIEFAKALGCASGSASDNISVVIIGTARPSWRIEGCRAAEDQKMAQWLEDAER